MIFGTGRHFLHSGRHRVATIVATHGSSMQQENNNLAYLLVFLKLKETLRNLHLIIRNDGVTCSSHVSGTISLMRQQFLHDLAQQLVGNHLRSRPWALPPSSLRSSYFSDKAGTNPIFAPKIIDALLLCNLMEVDQNLNARHLP